MRVDREPPHAAGWYARRGKRLFDVACAALGLSVCALPLAIAAAISWLVQGRPVFFGQQRIGRHGTRFTIWKFRTMRVRAAADSAVTVAGDARVTTWGRYLRRLKLDELPQLVCVLQGAMSLVGPRPDVPGYWDRLAGRDRKLLDLRPGITGPATLVFRDEERLLAGAADPQAFNDEIVFPEKVRLNRRYRDELTFAGDIRWILLTVAPQRMLRSYLVSRGWLDPADPRFNREP